GIVIPNEALLLLPREGPERAVRMPRVWCAAISRTLGAHPNWRETGEPRSGERMQPTAQAVGRVQRRRKPQRGRKRLVPNIFLVRAIPFFLRNARNSS